MRARFVTEENKKWWTLAAVSFGLFMIMLDNTVVNVALPSIQRDLGVGLSELEWIVSGYALTFAALMLIGGKLADAYGRRLIFVVGIVVFTLASLLCGLATSGDMLIASRVLQGAGAALDEPGDALDHRRDVPAAAAGDGDRDLGGRVGARARDRPPRRRAADGARELELDLLRQRPRRDPRHLRQLPPDRRVARPDARAARPAWPRDVGDRALRAHLRADRGEHLRLGIRADRGRVRVSAASLVLLRAARAPPARADARPHALPKPDLRRRQPGRSARRARDVRRLLLRLPVHAEHPRLLGRPGRARRSCP